MIDLIAVLSASRLDRKRKADRSYLTQDCRGYYVTEKGSSVAPTPGAVP